MLSAIGSPLVAGSTSAPMATKHVKVLRSFYLDRKPTVVGAIHEVEARFAAELAAANKVSIVDAPKPAEPAPQEPEAPTHERAPRRSSRNAG